MYLLLTSIESQLMGKDCVWVDKCESNLLFTHNQFIRNFKHLMDDVERPVLTYQMLLLAQQADVCMARLKQEWTDFIDTRVRKIHDSYYG